MPYTKLFFLIKSSEQVKLIMPGLHVPGVYTVPDLDPGQYDANTLCPVSNKQVDWLYVPKSGYDLLPTYNTDELRIIAEETIFAHCFPWNKMWHICVYTRHTKLSVTTICF